MVTVDDRVRASSACALGRVVATGLMVMRWNLDCGNNSTRELSQAFNIVLPPSPLERDRHSFDSTSSFYGIGKKDCP